MIIAAPSSTQKAYGERDPAMHQIKVGQHWRFGVKVQVGVDSQSKVIHAVAVTPANTANGDVKGQPFHGQETRVLGDQAYERQKALIRAKAPKAKDFTNRQCRWRHFLGEAIQTKNKEQAADSGGVRALDRRDQVVVRLHQGARGLPRVVNASS